MVLRFPGNQFTGGIIPALDELVRSNTIRVIDLIFAKKDREGNLSVTELSEMDPETYERFRAIVTPETTEGLLSDEDINDLAARLPNDSSAGVMLFENTWAKRFKDAVDEAKGEVVVSERIPGDVVNEIEHEVRR